MDLFSLTCTTCKTRLKVRDQAAIGQILACPKCGGMVMIKPPPSWSEVSQAKAELPTATEVVGSVPPLDRTVDSAAFDIVEELLSDAPPRSQPPKTAPAPNAAPAHSPAVPPPAAPAASPAAPVPTAASPPKPRFVGGPPAPRVPSPTGAAASKADARPPESRSEARPEGKAAAPLPTPSPAKTVAAPAQTPAPSSRAASSVWRGSPENTAAPPAKQPSELPNRRRYWLLMSGSVALGILLAFAAVTAAIHVFRRPVTAARPSPNANRPEQATVPPIEPRPKTRPDESPRQTAETPARSPTNDAKAPPAVTTAPAPAVPDATANTSQTLPAPDPLGLVKEPPAAQAIAAKVASAIERFDRILGGASDDPLARPDSPPPAEPPPGDSTARPLAPRPPPREVDVAKRLADPLPGIDTAGTPLADFVQVLSDLTTIPITLELPLTPATTESPIVFSATNTTIGKALSDALATVRLEYVLSNDQLLIRRPEPAPYAPHTAIVKDLTSGDEQQLADLVELVKAVVEPAAWEEGDDGGSLAADSGQGTIIIRQRRAVQAQVLLALEKLRAARSPPLPHVWKLDPENFALTSRWSQARSRLETPLTLTFSQPTRLLTIVERLGEVAGMRILVDWHDVAAAGWNPAGEATLVASNQPLARALDALLTPLDLTWRVIDSRTIQVVTPTRLAAQGELEVYPLDDLPGRGTSVDALLAKLRAALGESAFRSAGGSGELKLTPDGRNLLAWLPQPKQRELEGLLDKMRSETRK